MAVVDFEQIGHFASRGQVVSLGDQAVSLVPSVVGGGSCFGTGVWRDDLPWLDTDVWKD